PRISLVPKGGLNLMEDKAVKMEWEGSPELAPGNSAPFTFLSKMPNVSA
ncbi:MAG: hypothetical protein GY862_35240, partial [Gammaproteobacteria bacterium]|nr:hypothetical protein [Gammaproteobacteria bacterium]